jgi:hypothetical protein
MRRAKAKGKEHHFGDRAISILSHTCGIRDRNETILRKGASLRRTGQGTRGRGDTGTGGHGDKGRIWIADCGFRLSRDKAVAG